MTIKLVKEKDKDAFNKAATHPLQSWQWGEFRKKTGNRIVRMAAFQKERLQQAIQLTLHPVPLTNFKIGALIKGPRPTKRMLVALKVLAKKENLIFTKIEPNIGIKAGGRSTNLLKQFKAIPGRALFTPTSFWIDLRKSEKELLESFHSKTRYNIRLAQKRGVKIREDNSPKAFEKYISLTRETIKRQEFYAHTEKYHRLMWQTLHREMVAARKEPTARLLVARYKGEIITTWILFVWHDFLYYPYGASSDKHKNIMANNLIMWEAIRFGKKLGLKTFDLWGREPGKGFTRFKEGYNPQIVNFLGTWDLVSNPLYYPYRVMETIRWALLRFRNQLAFLKPKF